MEGKEEAIRHQGRHPGSAAHLILPYVQTPEGLY